MNILMCYYNNSDGVNVTGHVDYADERPVFVLENARREKFNQPGRKRDPLKDNRFVELFRKETQTASIANHSYYLISYHNQKKNSKICNLIEYQALFTGAERSFAVFAW